MTRSTPDRLLDAAGELIVEQGWRGVTSRAVAERAGVHNGVVHYHFASVDDLRRQAVYRALQQALDAEAQADESSVGSYVASSVRATEKLTGDPVLGALMLEALMQTPRDAELRAVFSEGLRPQREQVAGLVRQAQETGRIPDDIEATALGTALVALVDGLELHRFADPGLDVVAAGEAVARLLGWDGP